MKYFIAVLFLFVPILARGATCLIGQNFEDDVCQACPFAYYCPGDDNKYHCPPTTQGGIVGTWNAEIRSMEGATQIEMCLNWDQPHTFDHGTGTIRYYYNPDTNKYDTGPNTASPTKCDAGYYSALVDSANKNYDCVPVGQDYYSPADDLKRYQCTSGYTTNTETATEISECVPLEICDAGYYYEDGCKLCSTGYYCPGDNTKYKCPDGANTWSETGSTQGCTRIEECLQKYVPHTFDHGTGTIRCFYNPNTEQYDVRCHMAAPKKCDAGYYSTKNDCLPVEYGFYSPADDLSRYQCTDGYTTRTTIATDKSDCVLLCRAGATEFHVSDYVFNIYAEKYTKLAINIGFGDGSVCYVPLVEGSGKGALNVDYKGVIYHTSH